MHKIKEQMVNGKEQMVNGKEQMVRVVEQFEGPGSGNNLKDICANEAEEDGGTGEAVDADPGIEEAGIGSDGEAPEQDPGDKRVMRKMANPLLPTASEVEEHRLTHLPFRSWCPFCIKGRGVERSHFRAERDEDALGEVHLDYCFP
jgi:hypothetical protein